MKLLRPTHFRAQVDTIHTLGRLRAPASLAAAVLALRSSSQAAHTRKICNFISNETFRTMAAASEATATEPVADADASQPPSSVLEINPDTYDDQLQSKVAKIKEQFSNFKCPEIEVHTSPPMHYRQRTELSVWHDQGDMYYVMYKPVPGQQRPQRTRVETFPVASKLINKLMVAVREYVIKHTVLRERLFQVNLHTTLAGDAMVTLLYHKKLDDTWKAAAKELKAHLEKEGMMGGGSSSAGGEGSGTLAVIGRARKQKVELDRGYVIERMQVAGREYVYQQLEGAFSQPNGDVCQKMLTWAQEVTRGSEGDMLELYCGNGNFTIPLSQSFRRVVATELSKTGVEAAKYNLKVNGVDNMFVARMSSEEFTETWRAKASKRRLEGLVWKELDLKTLLVDPPRAGLDPATVQLIAEFDACVYISCNPDTLHDNLKVAVKTHDIKRFAVFDQFPYTHHLECGVYLVKRKD